MSSRNEQFQADVSRAADNWYVRGEVANAGSVWVEAEAKTGSKYVVVVTELPAHMDIPGTHLVSVVEPWRTAWPVSLPAEIHLDYAMERFRNPARTPEQVHGGDLQAIAMTINYALAHFNEHTAKAAKSPRGVY